MNLATQQQAQQLFQEASRLAGEGLFDEMERVAAQAMQLARAGLHEPSSAAERTVSTPDTVTPRPARWLRRDDGGTLAHAFALYDDGELSASTLCHQMARTGATWIASPRGTHDRCMRCEGFFR